MKDIFRFIMERKKFILVPVLVVLLVIALILVVGGVTGTLPFVYALF